LAGCRDKREISFVMTLWSSIGGELGKSRFRLLLLLLLMIVHFEGAVNLNEVFLLHLSEAHRAVVLVARRNKVGISRCIFVATLETPAVEHRILQQGVHQSRRRVHSRAHAGVNYEVAIRLHPLRDAVVVLHRAEASGYRILETLYFFFIVRHRHSEAGVVRSTL